MPFIESIPEAKWQALCHPREPEVTEEVNGYFLQHWPFPNDKARKKFVAAGFSRVTCFYFPKAKDDRIHFAARLLTLLFLIDDQLEYMSLEDGKAYNENLMPISRGDVLPDRSLPVEWITYDLWESMRAHDRVMADEILEPVFAFMRAQTDPARLKHMGLREYFVYRERDVGRALLAALMRFSMALHIAPQDLAIASPIDHNCSKHLSIINDIWSYEKEVMASKELHAEGGALCTSVAILAQEAEIPADSAKRVLYSLCRELEAKHEQLVREVLTQCDTLALQDYIKGLEYQMSGNEMWSRTTMRYLAPSA